jgi:diadenylate cyclase
VPDLLSPISSALERLGPGDVLTILLIAGVIYWLLLWLRGTSAMSLLRGVAIVAALGLIAGNLFHLAVVDWLLANSFTALLVAIPVIFQPEIRRALERVGRTGVHTWRSRETSDGVEAVLLSVVQRCSEARQGALIILERETGLEDYVASGVRIDALPSAPLLLSIFFANAPLHDGAVILRGGRIAAASCMLPLSESTVSYTIGTRHRAALGISERTDALAIVVSEETGEISVASNGRLVRPVSTEGLIAALRGTRTETGGAAGLPDVAVSTLRPEPPPVDGAAVSP